MGTKKAGLSSSLLSLVGLIQPPLTIARRLCHPLLPLRRAMLSIFASPKSPELLTEKPITSGDISSNPVISTSEYAYTVSMSNPQPHSANYASDYHSNDSEY